MPIYRGPGGSGDSSTDAYASLIAGYASTATTKAAEAIAAAADALASELEAEDAEAAAIAAQIAAEAAQAAAEAVAGATATLNTLTDVTITTPADDELLAYDNGTSEWINQTKTEAGFGTAATEDVTTSATDTTAGRLLKVGDFGLGAAAGIYVFGRANLLGTVSQSAGVPTGAVIERGSNANGGYARFADGTLLMTHDIVVTTAAAGNSSSTWTYPSTPVSAPNVQTTALTGQPLRYNSSAVPGSTTAAIYGSDTGAGGVSLTIKCFAIGRWF